MFLLGWFSLVVFEIWPRWVSRSLEANDILCLFEAHGGSKDSVLGEACQGFVVHVWVKFVVHVWVGWWLMVPKGIVRFIGWSLFQDSVFLTSSLKVVIILVTVVEGRITLMPEFIWYMHLVWKDSPTHQYVVPVQSHSCIATSSISFCIDFREGFFTNPWIFVKNPPGN